MLQGDEIAEWKYTEAYTIRSSTGRFCGTYKVKYLEDHGTYSFAELVLVPIIERCKCLTEADISIQTKLREEISKYKTNPDSAFSSFYPTYHYFSRLMDQFKVQYDYLLLPKHEFIFNDVLVGGIGVIKIVIRGDRYVDSFELVSRRPGPLTYEQERILEYVQDKHCKESFAQELDEVGMFGNSVWRLTRENVKKLLQRVLCERQEIYRDQYEDLCYWTSETEEERKEKKYIKDLWKERNAFMSKFKPQYSVPVIKPKYNAKRLKR